MALKPDQRALVQLVCERGQSYADLADLLGIPESEVRERARAALAELGGADPDAEVGLTDYLLGQADPIGRADAVRHLQQNAGARELATDIATRLQAIAPQAELPKIPEPRGGRRRAATTSPRERPAAGPRQRDEVAGRPAVPPHHRTRLIAVLAGAGVLLLFGVLAIAGVFSGDDGSAEATGEEAAAGQGEVTTVPLEPRGGSGVAGEAGFGIASESLLVDLVIDGLDPEPPEDRVYVLWLLAADDAGYPVQIVIPDQGGRVDDQFQIPADVAVAVAGAARAVAVSESPARPLQRVIDEALEAESPLVPFSGELLAEGRIPRARGGRSGGGSGG